MLVAKKKRSRTILATRGKDIVVSIKLRDPLVTNRLVNKYCLFPYS